MLRSYLVWQQHGSVRIRATRAPNRPLERGEAPRFAAAHLPPGTAGYAYVHGDNARAAIARYRVQYREFLVRLPDRLVA